MPSVWAGTKGEAENIHEQWLFQRDGFIQPSKMFMSHLQAKEFKTRFLIGFLCNP